MSIHHNLNAPNQDGETPIMLATTERQVNILKVLIVASTLPFRGILESLQVLLEAEANVNRANQFAD